jgi:hypothetical protein
MRIAPWWQVWQVKLFFKNFPSMSPGKVSMNDQTRHTRH